MAIGPGLGVALAALLQAPAAWAQETEPDPPAEPAQEPEAEAPPGDEILVVADPAQRTLIDRTTYTVRDTAEARTTNGLELLQRIPSVDVTPQGQLRLLGRQGVRVQIDGVDVRDPATILRTLQGAQIARIEIVTNPSAQFSAQGTAGVINIVLRRAFAPGLGGSVTAGAGNFGSYDFRLSPTWTRGPLSLSGSLGATRNEYPSDFTLDRRDLDPDGGFERSIETGDRSFENRSVSASLVAAYRLTPKQILTFTARGSAIGGESARDSLFLTSLDPGRPLAQTSSGTSEGAFGTLAANYRREGGRPGETLTLLVEHSRGDFAGETDFVTRAGAQEPASFRIRSDFRFETMTAKADLLRPFANQHRLALGAALQHSRERSLFEQTGQLALSGEPFWSASTILGSFFEQAAYFSYQFPLLGGTILAGLRVEDRGYDDANGFAAGAGGTHLFPSLHVERRLAEGVTAQLSYSRRISWPGIGELDPALRFTDSTTVNAGNPLLRPEITAAYEAKLLAQPFGQTLELAAFLRRTDDLRTSLAELGDDGLLVLRTINLGTRISRGVNLSLQGILGGGFGYSLNGSFAALEVDRGDLALDVVEEASEYSLNTQVEYRDGPEGRRHTDRVELRARYFGPSELGLTRFASFLSVTASWSHAFTDRLTSVVNVTDPFGAPRSRYSFVTGSIVSEETSRQSGPRIIVSLTYTLGAPSRR